MMNRFFFSFYLLRAFFLIFICCLSPLANLSAQENDLQVTTPSGKIIESDISIDRDYLDYTLLSYVFGTMGDVLQCSGTSCSPLLGALFRLFNIALSTLGVAFLSYFVTMSAFSSSSSGDMMSQQFASNTIPLRNVAGIAFLLPNQYGYSLLQQIIMAIALMGSSLGNMMWHQLQDYANQGGLGARVNDQTGSVNYNQATAAADIIVRDLTRIAIAEIYLKDKANYSKSIALISSDSTTTPMDGAALVPKATLTTKIGNDAISGIKIEFKGEDRNINMSLARNKYLEIKYLLRTQVFDSNEAYNQLLSADSMTPAFNSYVITQLQQYSVELAQTLMRPESLNVDSQTEQLPSTGSWIFLPVKFFTLMGEGNRNALQSKALKSFEVTSDISMADLATKINNSGLFNEVANLDIKTQQDLSNYFGSSATVAQSLLLQSNLTISDEGVANPEDLTYKGFKHRYQEVINKLNSNESQPIIVFLEFGTEKMKELFRYLYILFFVQLVPILLTSIMSCCQGGGFFTIISSILVLGVTIITLLLMDLPMVLTLSFMVPLIPNLIYASAVIAWFVQVVSSVIAAPIMAIGLISAGPGLGRAGPALVLMLNLFIRPPMVVLGFVAGLLLFNTLVPLFTQSLLYVIDSLVSVESSVGSSSFFSGPIGFIISLIPIMLFQYAYLFGIIALITRSFTLVFSLPDQVLTWIGGQPLPFGRDVQQTVSKARQNVGQSSKEVQSTALQATKGVMGIAKQVKGKIDAKKAEAKKAAEMAVSVKTGGKVPPPSDD